MQNGYFAGQDVLNKYEIITLLGEGGFGQVFGARHKQLGVARALKILHPRMKKVTRAIYLYFQELFTLEAQFGAQLDNPHIIRVYDFEKDNDALILVMEYAPNGSLADLISRRGVKNEETSITEVINLTREIASGLVSIHELGAVHRDLKPANILFDKDNRAKVADLGLIQLPGNWLQEMNRGQRHPGTPAYMSPEQSIYNGYLKPASDIYSLGLIIFESLTGRHYLRQPKGSILRHFRSDAPVWLSTILERMLDPDPEKRPRNGNEIIEAMQPPASPAFEVSDPLLKTRSIFLPYGLDMRLVKVPAGSFLMGSMDSHPYFYPEQYPQHTVTLPEYWIGQFPVTLAQFAAFIRQTGYVTTAEKACEGLVNQDTPGGGFKFVKVRAASWACPYGPDRIIYMHPNRPVTMVSWEDAIKFCEWLSKTSGYRIRLPTEAEWEKAARGTDGRLWPWGNQIPDLKHCNFSRKLGYITSTGTFSPIGDSPYGCADMMGNVWEWTSSLFKSYPYDPQDGRENMNVFAHRVLRGGSLLHFPTTVYRDNDPQDACYFNDGFRVVISEMR